MLTSADEILLHQAPLTLSETVTSDHRFYDRCFVDTVAPDGSVTLGMGMGVYKNMNVLDGFLCVAIDGRQYNLRLSRALRDNFETAVGGLRYAIIEPMKVLRITLAPGICPIACDIEWHGTLAPLLEGQWWGTRSIINERVAVDVRRYEQPGLVRGWIEVAGKHLDVRDWFGGRDHSWGVRSDVGGFEPNNGGALFAGRGMLISWFLFATEAYGGFISRNEDDQGVQRGIDGLLRWRDGRKPDVHIVDADLDVHFPKGSRYYDGARMIARGADGSRWDIVVTPLGAGLICKGGGYNGGWTDARGFGVYRGAAHTEQDIYESGGDPHTALVRPAGSTLRHNQREQLAHVEINGVKGMGDCTIIAVGTLPQFGLAAEAEMRL